MWRDPRKGTYDLKVKVYAASDWQTADALNAFKDFFSIIQISQNNVDKKFLIAPHERSVE